VYGLEFFTAQRMVCMNMPIFCRWTQYFTASARPEFDDIERWGVYMSHYPSGASLHYLKHIG